jgi:hypothetical protein
VATVINTNPTPSSDSGSGVGLIVGIIIVIVVIALFFLFGLPYLRGGNTGTNNTTNIVPEGGGSDTEIDVPEQVDVNVNNP